MPGVASMVPFQVRFLYRRVSQFGLNRYCPICNSRLRRFRNIKGREEAQCPVCKSRERHRLVWLFLQRQTDFFDGKPKRMLHVAPEPEFIEKFKRIPNLDYLTGDLMSPRAMVKMDITDIQYPDATFDVIYCSHVLEHVPDDRKAMREFRRVLKPGGWALLLVPITVERTFEDFSVTSPEDRLRVFGQNDHVRRCGLDYVDRLTESGFNAKVISSLQVASEQEVSRMRMGIGSPLYYCTRA